MRQEVGRKARKMTNITAKEAKELADKINNPIIEKEFNRILELIKVKASEGDMSLTYNTTLPYSHQLFAKLESLGFTCILSSVPPLATRVIFDI